MADICQRQICRFLRCFCVFGTLHGWHGLRPWFPVKITNPHASVHARFRFFPGGKGFFFCISIVYRNSVRALPPSRPVKTASRPRVFSGFSRIFSCPRGVLPSTSPKLYPNAYYTSRQTKNPPFGRVFTFVTVPKIPSSIGYAAGPGPRSCPPLPCAAAAPYRRTGR